MRPKQPHGLTFHVRSLEEALAHYANERAHGRPNPTFTVDPSDYAKFAEYAKKSYTITAYRGKTPILLRGVLLHFEARAQQ